MAEIDHRESAGSHDEHAEGIVVSLKPDILGQVGDFPITNSMVTSLVGSVLLVILVVLFSRHLKAVPSRIQLVFELIVEKGFDYCKEVLGDEGLARKTFPLVASLFLFILFFNLIKFIPGAESITFDGHIFFKPLHADLNMTFALGLVAFIFVQFMGFFVLGAGRYIGKFVSYRRLHMLPLGLIEIISELAKLVSLSFRLFGNVLVGGILLLLLSHIFHYFLPVPVLLFEIFVAVLQASIFAMLTLIYVKLATDEPH